MDESEPAPLEGFEEEKIEPGTKRVDDELSAETETEDGSIKIGGADSDAESDATDGDSMAVAMPSRVTKM